MFQTFQYLDQSPSDWEVLLQSENCISYLNFVKDGSFAFITIIPWFTAPSFSSVIPQALEDSTLKCVTINPLHMDQCIIFYQRFAVLIEESKPVGKAHRCDRRPPNLSGFVTYYVH